MLYFESLVRENILRKYNDPGQIYEPSSDCGQTLGETVKAKKQLTEYLNSEKMKHAKVKQEKRLTA